ncbi:MAG TPA: AMP-binding protein, partial [Candidatus Methylomirabilis sp.]|nr:AMP-binding protein [Candidatus Methylomirabilis sp.]
MSGERGTFPQLLVAQSERLDDRVALREKQYGIWQQVTWRQYAARVREVSLGLAALGLERGDRVAVISGNRPAWLYFELAAQAVGAIPLGIYVDSLPAQIRQILDHSEARIVLVEDQEQADKVLSVRDTLPNLGRIAVDDLRGLETYRDPMLIELDAVAEAGRSSTPANPGSSRSSSRADAGLLDDRGHLVVIDRMQDVLRLGDGSRFSPALIENRLKFSPYIREAVVIGEDRPHVVALIQIDMGNVGNWAEANRLPFTTFKDLSQKREVSALVAETVARVNQGLPAAARIGGFALLEKELDADDDELTRTQKVRRGTILRKYASMIDELYSPAGRAGEVGRVAAGG